MNAHFALRSFARLPSYVPTDAWTPLVCRVRWDESPDVATFLLTPQDEARFAFEPGQFMTVRVPVGEGFIERCYTISSSAAVEGSVALTVKRKSGGVASNILHETLRPGTTIKAFGPAGRFGLPADAGASFLLISAGSGITPMMSIIRTAADLGAELDATFVTFARSQSDILFGDTLVDLSRRLPGLRSHIVLTQPDALWQSESGRVDAAMLQRLAPDLASRTVLCCGPEGFMVEVRKVVEAAGVPTSRYFEESFDFGSSGDEPQGATEGASAIGTLPTRRVTFAKSGKSFDVLPGQTILQAARSAGIPMASSCAKGVCGTCKCAKLAGEVVMSHGGGIRQREIDKGLILPCSSRPTSDVVLDR